MPGYKGHIIGGSVTYLMILQVMKLFQPPVIVLVQGFVFCILGSLFPDVDIKSKGQKIFYVVALLALSYFLYYQRIDLFIASSLLIFIPLLVKHRGIFHQLWFLIFISTAIAFLIGRFHEAYSVWAMKNALFFLAGAVSHIILDRIGTRFKKIWNKKA